MRAALCCLLLFAFAACNAAGTRNIVPASADVSGAAAPRSAAANPVTWTVQAGASTADGAIQDLHFYTNTVTIDAGDSVRWRVASAELHTVTFLSAAQLPPAPNTPLAERASGNTNYDGVEFLNSGLLRGGQTFTVRFIKPGVYVYRCLLHPPQMSGTVVVQESGTVYPHTQNDYVHAGAADEWLDLGAAQRSISTFPFPVHGTMLAAGIAPGLADSTPAHATVNRFLDVNDHSNLTRAGDVTIHAGATLTWMNEANNEPHTVTFPRAGSPPPQLPPFSPSSGGTIYNGSTLVNSGVLFSGNLFSLKFTKPGVYRYYCLFHTSEGMTGTVTVLP